MESKKKIMFAEDTKDLNKVVTAVLTHEGYEVESALDGEEASSSLKRTQTDMTP